MIALVLTSILCRGRLVINRFLPEYIYLGLNSDHLALSIGVHSMYSSVVTSMTLLPKRSMRMPVVKA